MIFFLANAPGITFYKRIQRYFPPRFKDLWSFGLITFSFVVSILVLNIFGH